MANRSRRDFTQQSLLLPLGSVAGELAISSPLAALLVSEAKAAPQAPDRRFFEGFKHEQIKTSGATINVVYGGKGSPLLLLHGIPETHVLWRKVAPALAQNFTLVIADLRGYGDSSKPPGGADHFAYSKRAMAQDQVEVMEHLGFASLRSSGTIAEAVSLTAWRWITLTASPGSRSWILCPPISAIKRSARNSPLSSSIGLCSTSHLPSRRPCSEIAPSFFSKRCCSGSVGKSRARAFLSG